MSKSRTNPLAALIEFKLRPGTDADLGYVIDTWTRSAMPEYPEARRTVFRVALKKYLDRLLTAGASLTVASAADEPTVVYGWILTSNDGGGGSIVRFIYVRGRYRGCRIARALVMDVLGEPRIYTSSRLTVDARAIAGTHPDLITFLPLSE